MHSFFKLTAPAAAVFALSFVALPAQAATAVYTISGTGSGSLNGTAFNNAIFTFTLTGDTANLTGINSIDPLASATAAIAGFATTTFSIPTRIGVNTSNNVAYFSRSVGIGGSDLFNFNVGTPQNIGVSFGPLTGTNISALGQFVNVATTGGLLTFNSSSSVQFTGVIGGAVPEPATWLMMIAGFGLVGGMMRRRRTQISYKFA